MTKCDVRTEQNIKLEIVVISEPLIVINYRHRVTQWGGLPPRSSTSVSGFLRRELFLNQFRYLTFFLKDPKKGIEIYSPENLN